MAENADLKTGVKTPAAGPGSRPGTPPPPPGSLPRVGSGSLARVGSGGGMSLQVFGRKPPDGFLAAPPAQLSAQLQAK